jgi:hypothetical protein
MNYKYYERLHTGGGGDNRVHWMNTVRLRRAELIVAYRRRNPTLQKRGQEFYALGMSVGAVLSSVSLHHVGSVLETMRQLMYEYDFCYHTKGTASQNISLMMATDRGLFPIGDVTRPRAASSSSFISSSSLTPTSTSTTASPNTDAPTLYKQYNRPLYLNLQTSQCPGDGIDYVEIVLSLCTILSQFYDLVLRSATHIDHGGWSSILLSVDASLTKRVIQVISDDLHGIAIDLLREQQKQIATLFNSELLIPTLFGKS